MADFLLAYNETLQHEGGYSNNPKDTGGETYKGISRKNFPNWSGWGIIDDLKRTNGFQVKHLDANQPLQVQVQKFYKAEFWDKMSLDLVAYQQIATELFDTAVNMGLGTAGRFLQTVLNVANKNGTLYPDLSVDGNIGNATIKALNSHPTPLNILIGLNALQGARYIDICLKNPSQEVFYNGWIKRAVTYK